MGYSNAKRRSRQPAVVVEIGNDWLKILEGHCSRGRVTVSKVHLQRFERLDESLSEAVAAAFAKNGLRKRPVIVCLPRQMANVRMLDLPSVDPEEIADMVHLQTSRQTPYSNEEIVSGHRLTGWSHDGYSRVVLAIVQRSLLRQRCQLLEAAGLEVERLSLSTEGLLNWAAMALPRDQTHATVLLDVDSYYTDFSVVAPEGLLFTRSILVGANQLRESYARWSEKLAREAQRSLEIWRGESAGMSAQKMVVTGAGAHIPDLGADLERELKLATEVVDCMEGVKGDVGSTEQNNVSMTALMGMAAAPEALQFNLVPESVRRKQVLLARAKGMQAFAALLTAALLSVSLVGTLRLYARSSRLDALRAEFMQTEQAVRALEKKQEIIKVVRARQDTRFAVISLMSELQGLIPPDVTFDEIDIEGDKEQVLLVGTATSRPDVRTLVKNCEQSPLLQDVREDGPTRRDNDSGRFRFRVLCALEKPK